MPGVRLVLLVLTASTGLFHQAFVCAGDVDQLSKRSMEQMRVKELKAVLKRRGVECPVSVRSRSTSRAGLEPGTTYDEWSRPLDLRFT